MPAPEIIIEPFKSLIGVYEVVGYGKVAKPNGPALECRVAVLLARNVDSPKFNEQTDCHLAWIGCGQLDLIPIGSRWRDGVRVTKGDFFVDVPAKTCAGIYGFFKDTLIYTGHPNPPFSTRRFPSSLIADSRCFIVKQPESAHNMYGKAPDTIFIPKMEVARALFGVSSTFLKEMFDGVRDNSVAPDRGLVIRNWCESSKKDSSDPNSAKIVNIWSRKDLTNAEALVVGAILTDKTMREAYNPICQVLRISTEWQANQPAIFEMAWPFIMPIQMQFEGRWIETAINKRRFMVSRITGLDYAYDFEELQINHMGTSSDKAGVEQPPRIGRFYLSSARRISVRTNHPSSTMRLPITKRTDQLSNAMTANVKIEHVAHGGPAMPQIGILGENPRDVLNAGTADRDSQADINTVKLDVSRKGTASQTTKSNNQIGAASPDVVDALWRTWNALETASSTEFWGVIPFPDPNFPGFLDPFDFENDILIAEVSVGAHRIIVVDSGTTRAFPRSLGLLKSDNGASLTTEEAARIREFANKQFGRWGCVDCRAFDGYIVSVSHRPIATTDSIERYAGLLARVIKSAIK